MIAVETEIEIRIAELKKRILAGKERCISAGEKVFGPEYSVGKLPEPVQ